MKEKIDKEKCGGCSICENIAKDVFEMIGSKGKLTLDSIEKKLERSARDAIYRCAVNEIEISNSELDQDFLDHMEKIENEWFK